MLKSRKMKNVTHRVKASNDRKVKAGLRQIKIWVSNNPDNVEANKVRNYATKLPETKAITTTLKK